MRSRTRQDHVSTRPDGPTSTIIVGDPGDPHIRAVAELLSPDDLVIVEVSRLASLLYTFEAAHALHPGVDPETVDVTACTPTRGWLRRLTPAGWDEGAPVDQRRADAWAQRLITLARSLREPTVSWLSTIDDLLAAQNRTVQYRAARDSGIQTVEAAADLTEAVADDRCGTGANPDPADPPVATAAGAHDGNRPARRSDQPQQRLSVITVQNRAWISEVRTGAGNASPPGHAPTRGEFGPLAPWPAVQHAAVTLATSLRLGLSCQSWIVDDDGPRFAGLDPHGQWLHLPDDTTRPVCHAIAGWLAGQSP